MIVIKVKGIDAGGAANDAELKISKEKYNTLKELLQLFSVRDELERMEEEANVLHSALFNLKSAAKTLRPSDQQTACEIDYIIDHLEKAYYEIDERLREIEKEFGDDKV